jgi:hypothetical protein
MKTVMTSRRFFQSAPDLIRKGISVLSKIIPILVICLLALAGCLYTSQEPVGETPASINPQEWEGTWVSNDSEAGTRVLQIFNPPQGILIMKHNKWNPQKKREETETSWLYLRQSGDWLFASWREVGTSTFFWGGRIENRAMEGGRMLLLWRPNGAVVTPMVERGELPGRWVGDKGKTLVLGPWLSRHYQVMRDKAKEVFSFGNNPTVFVRVANP